MEVFSSSASDGVAVLIQEIKDRKINVCSNNYFVCDLERQVFAYYEFPETTSPILPAHPNRYRRAIQLRFAFPAKTDCNKDVLYQKLKQYFEIQPMADVVHWLSTNHEPVLLVYVIEDEYTAFRELSVGNVSTSGYGTGGLPSVSNILLV